jgi:hypothetical protein
VVLRDRLLQVIPASHYSGEIPLASDEACDHEGARVKASAVAANAIRWATSGRMKLPGKEDEVIEEGKCEIRF